MRKILLPIILLLSNLSFGQQCIDINVCVSSSCGASGTTSYLYSDQLFGVNTRNSFYQHNISDLKSFIGIFGLPIKSFYYPGGSIARLYHYSETPPKAFGVNSAEESTYININCNATCSGSGNCVQYCSDQGYSGTSNFYDLQLNLCDYNNNGIPDIGLTLSTNMYFDRQNNDLNQIFYKAKNTFPGYPVSIDAIVLGTEIHKDNVYTQTTYKNNYLDYLSPDQTVGYKVEAFRKITGNGGVLPVSASPFSGLTNSAYSINNLKSTYGYSGSPIVFDASDNTGASCWNKSIINWSCTGGGGCAASRCLPRMTGVSTNSGCINWWWDVNSDIIAGQTSNVLKNSVAIRELNEFFAEADDPDANEKSFYEYYNGLNTITNSNDGFDKMYIPQWGINGVGASSSNDILRNSLLHYIFTWRFFFKMMAYNLENDYSGSTKMVIKGAYFDNYVALNPTNHPTYGDPAFDLVYKNSDGSYVTSTSGDAFADLSTVVGRRYFKFVNPQSAIMIGNCTGNSLPPNLYAYYFDTNPNQAPPAKYCVYIINYSGQSVKIANVRMNGNKMAGTFSCKRIYTNEPNGLGVLVDKTDTSNYHVITSSITIDPCNPTTDLAFDMEPFCIAKLTWQQYLGCKDADSSVDDQSPFELQVFPNPTSDVLNIDANISGITSIQITDLTGNVLIWQLYNPNESEITLKQLNISHLSNGLYLIKIRVNQQVEIRKFTVIK